jgi:hypothetical protein
MMYNELDTVQNVQHRKFVEGVRKIKYKMR